MVSFFLSLLLLCLKWSLCCTATQHTHTRTHTHTHAHPSLIGFQTDASDSERMLVAGDVPWYITSILQQLEWSDSTNL